MATFGDMVTRIEDEIARTDLNAQIHKAVRDAISYYETMRWRFNETQVTWTSSAYQQIYTLSDVSTLTKLPVDVDHITYSTHRVSLSASSGTVDDEKYLLKKRPWSWFDRVAQNNVQGDPVHWAWYGNTIRVWPPEHSISTSLKPVFIMSAIVPPDIDNEISLSSTASVSNVWFNEAERLVRYRSKAILYADVIREMGEAQKFSSMADAEYRKMRYDNAQLVGVGRISAPRGYF